ncbi:GlcG/HbpS family heme-binding protein [Paenibacillus abyssi]|uniref:Cobalamin adenosyltransferase n=1 Tax=Paenibacillus abyssi TaxID=1340531 RepID=A0A917CWA4_9BACL|nr:heme-binding protein [Paenibacillus abyssi]GGG01242.1 hypothetical protein GCM10010916_17970 [Paenibacillus abyssi]
MGLQEQKPILTAHMVMKLLEAGVHKANELQIAINIMVMDDGGNMKGFMRMDQAPLMGGAIAGKKAYTAAGFGIPTADWYSIIKDDAALMYGVAQIDRMTTLGGGLPIYYASQLIGGIGVSGGTSEQDAICAQAALNILTQ